MRKYFSFLLATLLSIKLAAQPTIYSFTPQSGPAGTVVTITGTNFHPTATGNYVYFGAVRAAVSTASATSLTVIVPAGATYQPISVTVNSLTAYSDRPFVVVFGGGKPMESNPDGSQNTFEPKADFATDLHPNGVAIADFDGDGRPDMATSNNYSTAGSPASVSVLRNTSIPGSVSFSTRSDLRTGVMTYAIAAGDVNGDGKPDLITTSIVDKTVSVFENTSTSGSITFASKVDFPTGDNPYSIGLGDFNKDGKPDLAVVNHLSNSVSLYKNTGTGGAISFASRVNLATALAPVSVVVRDFDADGKTDLAVSNELSNSVSVFKNLGTSDVLSFAPKTDLATGSRPSGLAVGDISHDGLPDLVVANKGTNNFSILRNTSSTGALSFAPKVDVSCGASPFSVSLGDLNGDGRIDVVAPSENLSVHQNSSSGSALSMGSTAYLWLSPAANMVAIADFDGDGKGDLAGSLFTVDKVSVLRNKNNEPTLKSFFPTSGAAGTVVTIRGANLSGVTAVHFGGGAAASFTVISDTEISAVVGTGTSGAVWVSNQYGAQKLGGFTYIAPPEISSFSPTVAATGDTVLIVGANFNGATSVGFGGASATSYRVGSPDTIRAVVGAGAHGSVTVTTPYGTAQAAGFQYLPKPYIASFTPLAAATGQTVTITGLNFNHTKSVSFGGTAAASFTIVSSTQLTAVLGLGASGSVQVTSDDGSGALGGFSYLPPPLVASFSPASARTGMLVVLKGANFTAATAVRFGGAPADTFVVASDTIITAVVGAGASGPVSVTTPQGSGTAPGFVFQPPPVIYSISPLSGPPGTILTINGSNFGAYPGSNKVTIGTVEAVIIEASADRLKVVVPERATNKGVVVTAHHLVASSGHRFSLTHPASRPAFDAASFPSNVLFNGGTDPYDITTADIDGDGSPEIIAPDVPFKSLAILRNTSKTDISFSTKVELKPYWVPINVVAGDLNGDGKVDLVAGNSSYSNTISVFMNKSTPGVISFAPRVDYPTARTPSVQVLLCDLDGDGRLDLLARTGTASVSVYLNKSTIDAIGFAPPVTYSIGNPGIIESWLVAEDLNGDGKPEIISNGSSIAILKNNSTPGNLSLSDTPFSMGGNTYPASLSVDDIDGDGHKDIIALASTFTVMVYRNSSTDEKFAFTPVSLYVSPANINEIKTGDLDGDARPELIYVQGPFNNQFSVFKNISTAGSISFAPKVDYPFTTPYGYSGLDLADIDGDNSLDLVIACSGSDATFVFQNKTGYAVPTTICAGKDTSLSVPRNGSAYQWQVNTGRGYTPLVDNGNYNGARTAALQLKNVSAAFHGHIYRCLTDGVPGLAFPLVVHAATVPAIQVSYTGCGSGILLFTATTTNAGSGAVIEWFVNDTLSGSGVSFTLKNAVDGTRVHAKLTSATACANPPGVASPITTVNCTTTAVSGADGVESVQIGPNPSTGLVYIKLKLNRGQKVSLDVLDQYGNKVYASHPVNAGLQMTRQIDLRNYPPGVYYVRAVIGGQFVTKKIVIGR